jgi:hypothetical protein
MIMALVMIPSFAKAADDKPPLTNADVVKMVKAELSENTIILAIQNSPNAFDTSPNGLIELKTAGVGEKIIDAMLTPLPKAVPEPLKTGATTTATSRTAPEPTQGMSVLASLWGSKQTRIDADRVFMIDGEKRNEMKFTMPGTRTRFIYAIQRFAVLPGTAARLRTTNRMPQFEMILPNNVEISSVVVFALLGVRSNGSREILIGGGFMTISEGLPKDRNIAINYEKSPDQSQAPEGYDVYRIKPASTLKAGEYALMISKASNGVMGPFGAAGMSYGFYEIGID